ncbi:MAG: DUF6473 family protein [Arenibacterium sp.]
MGLQNLDHFSLYKDLCQYGTSPQMCRGPKRNQRHGEIALLGGSETFGKFVRRPFAYILEEISGEICVNLGGSDLGLDALVADEDLLQVADRAEHVVIQVLSAANLTNPFYRVHPRRNDRFIEPTKALRDLFPEIDFTQFHFTRHLLSALQLESTTRFQQVVEALQVVWLRKMAVLIERYRGRVTLLWLQYDTPATRKGLIGAHTQLVDRRMVDELRPRLGGVIDISLKPAGFAGELNGNENGPFSLPAAAQMLGQASHYEVAETLHRGLNMIGEMKRPA